MQTTKSRLRLRLCLALVPVLAAAAFAPSPAQAAGAARVSFDPTRPHVMRDVRVAPEVPGRAPRLAPTRPSSTVTGSGQLHRETFGFALASSLGDPTVGYPSWDFSLLSTVAFFGLNVSSNGSLAQDSEWSVWNSSTLNGMVAAAHQHGTRVVLTIVLQDWSGNQGAMCAGLENYATTVSQTAAQVHAKGVDGVNVDYEGYNATCSNGKTTSAMLVSLLSGLRSALPRGDELTDDTYASSAAGSGGFFNLPALAPSVDAFFVMAYDLDYSNYSSAPLNCSSFCLNPVAPLSAYAYNDQATVAQYLAVVPAAKIILGVPYYGRKACVASPSANQKPTGTVTSDTYLDEISENTVPGTSNFATHGDSHDTAGQDPWTTWYSSSYRCWREMYWDDTASLGAKYDLVNSAGLRGTGFWALNFGGGAPELWNLLAEKFTQPTDLGGYLPSGPDATAAEAAGRVDVVTQAANGSVWDAYSTDGGRSYAWVNLGGYTTSSPTILSWPGHLEVFVRGGNGTVWHDWWNGSGWSGWYNLGGAAAGAPDASSSGTGHMDVVVRDGQGDLLHLWYANGAWQRWEVLATGVTNDPTVVSSEPGQLEVFWRAADGSLWHRYFYAGAWSGWYSLGGNLVGSPVATSWGGGRVDVFARGTNSALWHHAYSPGSGWGGWTSLGGSWTSDPGAAATAAGAVDVFERGQNLALWELALNGLA